jgi:hypothetical protein
LQSDGRTLEIKVKVQDSTNRPWFTRTYEEQVSRFAYDAEIRRRQEPFQNVYNRVVNDMQKHLARQDLNALRQIRTVSELRFARRFAPDAFSDYLASDARERYSIKHVPAIDDPVLQRVRRIRVRDAMFLDHPQGFYQKFDQDMANSYDNWRLESYTETETLEELKASALTRTVGGALAVVGGVLAQGSANPSARSAGVLGIGLGALLFKSGLEKNAEARMHTEALKELADSLNSEIQPQTIALTDSTVELSGTVNEQYEQWKSILQKIYVLETGQAAPSTTQN